MSDILRRMGEDATGYDFLDGKSAAYLRAWNEAVETISRSFAASEVGARGVEHPARPHGVRKDVQRSRALDPVRRRHP